MSYNHKDIVIFFSRIIVTIINYFILLVAICVLSLIIYGFYIFIFEPYPPGEDPVQKWWKNNHSESSPTPGAFIPASSERLLSANLEKFKVFTL